MDPVGCEEASASLENLARGWVVFGRVIYSVTGLEAEGSSHWALWTETEDTLPASSNAQGKSREDPDQFQSE